jgi:hypothetical protein
VAKPQKARARKATKKAGGVSPAPSDNGDFFQPDGTIRWRIGSTEYRLRPLEVGELIELDRSRREGAIDSTHAITRAAQMPEDGTLTAEEEAAKIAEIRAVNHADEDRRVAWLERLFELAEVHGKKLPVERVLDDNGAVVEIRTPGLPGWALRPGFANKALEHLQGPPPPGVL